MLALSLTCPYQKILPPLESTKYKYTSSVKYIFTQSVKYIFTSSVINRKQVRIIMTEVKIKIEGMMCGHCQASATKAISSVAGVSAAKVILADKEATVTYDPKKTKSENSSTRK